MGVSRDKNQQKRESKVGKEMIRKRENGSKE